MLGYSPWGEATPVCPLRAPCRVAWGSSVGDGLCLASRAFKLFHKLKTQHS